MVTLDKTGTLTKGSFQLAGCHPRPGWSRQQLLRTLGSLERGSSHPLAAAVLGYAAAQVRWGWLRLRCLICRRVASPVRGPNEPAAHSSGVLSSLLGQPPRPLAWLYLVQGVACDAAVEDARAVHGAGITALVEGRRVAAGTPSLLVSAAGVAGPEMAEAQAALEKEGGLGGGWAGLQLEPAAWGSSRQPPMCSLRSTGALAAPDLPPPFSSKSPKPLLAIFFPMLAGATGCFVAVDGQLAGWVRCG